MGGVKPPDHSQRVKAGMARARAAGRIPGPPARVPPETIQEHLRKGWPMLRIQRELHVGYRAVLRAKRAMEAVG